MAIDTTDRGLIENLLAELRYVHDTGDIRDSIKNSRDILERAAVRCGYESYPHYCEATQGDALDTHSATGIEPRA